MGIWLWVWLAVVAASLIIEFISMDMTSIWFAIAGLVSLILASFGTIGWEIQLIVFIILSSLLIIFVRKIAKKVLYRGKDETKTNVDSLVGKRYKLLTPIEQDKLGTLKVNDVVWSATTKEDGAIEEGKVVEIVSVEGNKLIVKKIKGALEKEEQTENQNAE